MTHSHPPLSPNLPSTSRVFTVAQLRQLDQRAVEEYHIPLELLMENAGAAVARVITQLQPPDLSLPVLLFVGPGNNGADALVAARHLASLGISTYLVFTFDPANPKILNNPLLATHLKITQALQLPTTIVHRDLSPLTPLLTPWRSPLRKIILVDGLFGTGLARPLEGLFAKLVNELNRLSQQHHWPLLAIDIPSGLHGDTGLPLPPGPAITAQYTLAFCGLKIGFLNPLASQYTGQVITTNIGAPAQLLRELSQPLEASAQTSS